MRLRFKDEQYFPRNGEPPSHAGLALDEIDQFSRLHLAAKANPLITKAALAGLLLISGGVGSIVVRSSLKWAFAPSRFDINKIRSGEKHAVIFVNGFLSAGNSDTDDWQTGIKEKYAQADWYHLDWDACSNPANLLSFQGIADAVLGPSRPAIAAWHLSLNAAETAGKLLAKAIVSTPGRTYTLAGHSLGARVIHFALKELSRQRQQCIENAYLLGGAVGGGLKDDHCWRLATTAVKGKIYNCYSRNDSVLEWAYRWANARISEPVGLSGIQLQHAHILNLDCSDIVSGHMKWKSQFQEILKRIDIGLGKPKNPLL
ncbi:DUF726 domain-containing protein [Massilia sp. SR12]